VFDAIDAPSNLPDRSVYQGITVLFAKPGHEADELIEWLIAKHPAAKRLTVVSSDHRLQTAIKRRRGTAVDSDVFLKRLESSERNIEAKPTSTSETKRPESDLDFWLHEFEDVRPDSIEQQLTDETAVPKNEWDIRVDNLQQTLQSPDELEKWLNDSDD
jgi:predicted RNA-binding protein with PIN domain